MEEFVTIVVGIIGFSPILLPILVLGYFLWSHNRPTNDLKKKILEDYPYMYTEQMKSGALRTTFISKEEYLGLKDFYDKRNFDKNGNLLQLIHVTSKAQINFVKADTGDDTYKEKRNRYKTHYHTIRKYSVK